MGVIKKRLLIHGDKAEKEMNVIFDSGASIIICYITKQNPDVISNRFYPKGNKIKQPVTLEWKKREIIGKCLVSTEVQRVSDKWKSTGN